MKKLFWLSVFFVALFGVTHKQAYADWVECPVNVVGPTGAASSGSGTSQTLTSPGEYVGVHAGCTPDSNGIKVQFQTSSPASVYIQSSDGTFVSQPFSGIAVDSYVLTDPKQLASLQLVNPPGLIFGDPGVHPVTYNHFQLFYWVPTASPTPSTLPSVTPTPSLLPTPSVAPTPLPTPSSAGGTISVTPSSSSVMAGSPFKVNVEVNGGGTALNAAQGNVTVSPNLTITGIQAPSSNACNFQYTQSPTQANPSFAGAIAGASSTDCVVYTLDVTPTAVGTGTITITNGSIKSFTNSAELLGTTINGSFSIAAQTQVSGLAPKNFFFDAFPFDTYQSSLTLTGQKDATVAHILMNGTETGVTYPTTSTWQLQMPPLSTGNNTFTFAGKDAAGNATASQSISINKHMLGDINGDGVVDIVDASLFAVDWEKNGNLTYPLSDMDGDGKVDLTDFSIFAKQEAAI